MPLSQKRRQTVSLFLGAISFAGLVFFGVFLSQSSEAGNQFLFGLSRVRFAIALVFLFLILAFLAGTALSIALRSDWQKQLEVRLDSLLLSSGGQFTALTSLYFILLTTSALLILSLVPLAEPIAFLEVILARLGTMLGWIWIASFLLALLLVFRYAETILEQGFFSPLRVAFWGWMFLAAYTLLVVNYRQAAFLLSLRGVEIPLIGLGAFFLVAAGLSQRFAGSRYQEMLNMILLASGIFLTTFVLYEHIAAWIGWVNKTRYAYWNLLADQFLHGRLYLENPPTTHDLAFFNGKWYVPMPPLPAILMMPLAILVGGDNLSTGSFSIFFSAINSVLMFLILDTLLQRKWIRLSRSRLLWLVALFAFGTNHLWVGLSGRAWFVSQVLTVTFMQVATLVALKAWSPWMIGASLAFAMASRPNSAMFWPFPFAIALQIARENGASFDWRRLTSWMMKSILPMGLAVAGLLIYNYARFGNFLDFGYTLLAGDPTVVGNAKTYGVFSAHFIAHNLNVMFLYLPTIQWGSLWPVLPSGAGMSIFLSTPPLIYLFHRYQRQWWVMGAWISVLFMFILLVLYHNTGAHQFGYRYILDAIVPLVALLAVALGKKVPWHFIALTILSILINIYGANWFMNG